MQPYFEQKTNIFLSHEYGDHNFPAHFHHHIEIAYCISGKQNIKIGEKNYTLNKGDAAVIFPNTVHEYINYDGVCDEPIEMIAVVCNVNLLVEIYPEIITKSTLNPFLESRLITENADNAFRNIISAKNNIELLGWTLILISDLLENMELIDVDSNVSLPSKIINYINANFKENLTIEHIAKVFGYHPSYIAHLFCDQLKIPFRTYLGAVRSEYAALQIQSNKDNFTKIAYESGFNSLNTFCRCFKKHFSQTPSQYKKSIKNNKKH